MSHALYLHALLPELDGESEHGPFHSKEVDTIHPYLAPADHAWSNTALK